MSSRSSQRKVQTRRTSDPLESRQCCDNNMGRMKEAWIEVMEEGKLDVDT